MSQYSVEVDSLYDFIDGVMDNDARLIYLLRREAERIALASKQRGWVAREYRKARESGGTR